VSLLDVMSRSLHGEQPATPLEWPELARYLRDEYWDSRENQARKLRAATRQRFYLGKGDSEMEEMLGQVMTDPEVIKLRSQWIAHAKFNNVLRRAVNELATVYSQPASRTVEGEENNAKYQTIQRRTRMHEVMQRVNRLGYLHRAVFVYPRTRTNAAGQVEPVLEVVTPDRFDAICHPHDPTMLVAISIDLRLKSATGLQRLPARVVITPTEVIEVDSAGQFIESTLQPHGYGRIPGVLFCVEPPSGALLDQSATDDLESAHRAVWFENILLLKESKSATKQTLVMGDVSATARGQVDDSERPAHLQDGATATTLDRSMDLSMFRDTARSIYETAAANHGIPPSTLDHQGVQSAEARELQRTPLKELRLQQHVPLRDVERELAEVQSAVYAQIKDCAFDVVGWFVDFADPQTPLGQKEALEVFEHMRRLGLTSTVAWILERNSDLTRDQAVALIELFVEDETERNRLMRPLQRISGSMGASMPGAVNAQSSSAQDSTLEEAA
jgi:hypothetical protein